ncbi:hypothetical protein AAON49_08620 [Pseudotenacibaculum sp. MALMAid0570]|uniref:hypothetical protein n=1 Tax=Pseudotenacibaculum sp. MALMAid0570 TaxID=3143938 RepID=UPI0032DEEACA
MKELLESTVLQFEIEDFAHLMIDKRYDFSSLKKKVCDLPLSNDNRKIVLQRIDFANKRINKPLSWSETILFILLPFGRFNRYVKSTFINTEEELRLGFKRRVDEFVIYSIVGIVMYVLVALGIIYI